MKHGVIIILSLLALLIRPSFQQLNINVEIKADNTNVTLADNALSAELSQANLTQGYIQAITKEELIVDICPVGTFSSPNGGVCFDCPSGTASPVEGANNDMTCGACNAGTFAAAKSSECTKCPINTFSTAHKAATVSQCLTCPADTTSTVGSDNVRSCVCRSGLFVSNNLVSAFDGITASLGFEGAVSINLPHVVC